MEIAVNKAGRVMLAILVGGGFALSSPGAFASDLESSMRAALDNSALLSWRGKAGLACAKTSTQTR